MRMASALYVQYVKSTRRRRFPALLGPISGEELMARAGKRRDTGISVGGKPEVLAQPEAKLRNQWNVNIAGSQDGYF